MKIKLLILFLSGALLVLFLFIDLQSASHSTTDKWASFGLGAMIPIFISNVIASIIRFRKQKAL